MLEKIYPFLISVNLYFNLSKILDRVQTTNETCAFGDLNLWLPSSDCFEFLRIIRETMQATRCRVIKPKITGSDGRLALTCPAGRPPVWSRFTSQCSKRACTLPREYKLVCLHESPRPSASPLVNNFSFTSCLVFDNTMSKKKHDYEKTTIT